MLEYCNNFIEKTEQSINGKIIKIQNEQNINKHKKTK